MNLKTQKRLASKIMGCSPKRIVFDNERLEDIKEAITKADLRALVIDNAITKKAEKGVSRARANKRLSQKRKGRQKGKGSRQGKNTAREPRKTKWMHKIRLQRAFLAELKEKAMLETKVYRDLYLKTKGGFFRNKRHIKLYLEEKKLITEKKKVKSK